MACVMTWADDELHAKLINGTFQMWLDSFGPLAESRRSRATFGMCHLSI